MLQCQLIMATLKLKKSPGAPAPHKPLRPGAPRPRPTLAQAQAERAAHAATRPARHPATPPAPGAAAQLREGERVSKRLAALGPASRREADAWIEAGRVEVNRKRAGL